MKTRVEKPRSPARRPARNASGLGRTEGARRAAERRERTALLAELDELLRHDWFCEGLESGLGG